MRMRSSPLKIASIEPARTPEAVRIEASVDAVEPLPFVPQSAPSEPALRSPAP